MTGSSDCCMDELGLRRVSCAQNLRNSTYRVITSGGLSVDNPSNGIFSKPHSNNIMSEPVIILNGLLHEALVKQSISDMEYFADSMPMAVMMVLASEAHNTDHANLGTELFCLLDSLTSRLRNIDEPIPCLYRCQTGVYTTLPKMEKILKDSV